MKFPVVCVFLLLTNAIAQAAEAPSAIVWPYPQDIPKASSAAPGIAGETPYDIVRFLMTRGPSNVQLSPDGQTVAFVSNVTGKPQLFTLGEAHGSAKQITFGRAVTAYAWAPAGDWLLYASDRDGNEREGYTLISPDGTRERPLSQSSKAFRSFGGFAGDGGEIAYASTERNGIDYDIFIQNVSNGKIRSIYEGRYGFYAAGWQPKGRHLLMQETRGEDGNNLYLLNADSGAVKELFNPQISAEYSSFAWLSDGSGFYLATNHDREFSGLAYYDLAAGKLTMLRTPEHDVGNVQLLGSDRYLAWTTNQDGYDRLHVLDRKRDKDLDVPALPPGVYDLSGARDARRLVVRMTGPKTPGEVWMWDLKAMPTRVLSPTLAGINPKTLVVPEAVRFKAQDGVMLYGLLYQPTPRAPGGRPPLMLKVHGGPTGQARPRFDGVSQYLVGRGYAVFDFNFRGSTGFGKTFARLDNGRLRPNAVRDIKDAVAWLGESANIDPSRMAIMGGSYGGYLTNAAVGEYPDMFKAAVSFVGVSNWVRALEEASPALKASDRVEYGDISDPDDRAFFADISPIAKAHRVRTPMVVIHGANDPRDPVTESDNLVEVVRKQEVDVRYLRFADEGHGLRKLGNRITAYREIADFLDEKLKQSGAR